MGFGCAQIRTNVERQEILLMLCLYFFFLLALIEIYNTLFILFLV